MPRRVFYIRLTRDELYARLRSLPEILAGRAMDRGGIAHGFRMRLAMAFFSKVKQAFIVKSRGGTDDAGIKWKPLTRAYLAYGRRFGRGEQKALKDAAGLTLAHRYAPGGHKGLLTAAQLKRWKGVFVHNLKWLATRYPLEEAKSRAAAIAWATIKREGAKTKLQVFGSRLVEILRDTGLLFNSISPGTLTRTGASANYAPTPEQVVKELGASMLVGTNVAYAAANHKRRPLWPESDQLPESWAEDFQESAAEGIPIAVQMMAEGTL